MTTTQVMILDGSGELDIDFKKIKEHPEWREFLKGKDLSRAFGLKYEGIFARINSDIVRILACRDVETFEKMAQEHKEDVLVNWYRATGERFVPSYIVMLNFPENEIENFLANYKKWYQLEKIDKYNDNPEGKTTLLKTAYAMGVFHEKNNGFNIMLQLLSGIPQELSIEEYNLVISSFENKSEDNGALENISAKKLFETSYTANNKGRYVLRIEKQNDKKSVKIIREILEKAGLPKILTPEKFHQMFDNFAMRYNPEFVRFLDENIEEILLNPDYIKDIAKIQRQFMDIMRINSGKRISLKMAQDYVKSIAYEDIEVGNERVAEQAKIAGYAQMDFEMLQCIYNEGEIRNFSSIPRISGKYKKYTYEMLRLDEPLALTVGYHVGCCQKINDSGQTSMEHSAVSEDGRVMCIRDAEGRIVAESWVWRNQDVICFDSIEISKKILSEYAKLNPINGKKELASEVLEVYKTAIDELVSIDIATYDNLLTRGEITLEQYKALVLGKVTIGRGWDSIAGVLQEDKSLVKDEKPVLSKVTERFPSVYTDANIQYVVKQREKREGKNCENLRIYEDDIPVYNENNMSSTLMLTMRRMQGARMKSDFIFEDINGSTESQKLINIVAREYEFEPSNTEIMATSRMMLIYSREEDKIVIGDLFSSPIKKELSMYEKRKNQEHIMYQIQKALKQLKAYNIEIDLSALSEEQQEILQDMLNNIDNERDRIVER